MAKQQNNKQKFMAGLFWSYGERITAQCISLIISIILARLLEPAQYGIISIVMIFITMCNAMVIGGFGNALVQKKDADDLDFSTMLYCSFGLAVILYIALFFAAPFIAEFYDTPLLTQVIRVLGIRVPISGINTIQHAKVQKEFAFKRFFFATLFGTSLSAVVGITMAFYGFGVWALVAQYLTNTITDTIVLFIVNNWRPRLVFSFARAKFLLSYGWKVLATTMVYTIVGDLRSLIIGKVFGTSDLAFYDQGKKFPNLLVSNINASISKVMFPVLSAHQDDLWRIKRMCRRSVRIGVFLLCPLLIGLISVADTFVEVVLTEKWLPCVPYLRIIAIVFLVRPLTTTCQQAIMAIGRSDVTLKIEIILNAMAIAMLCVSVFRFQSILMIAWSNVITECVSLTMFMYYAKKLIGYRHREQLQDLLPAFLLSAVMGVAVNLLHLLSINSLIILIMQVFLGISIYFIGGILFKMDSLIYLLKMIDEKANIKPIKWVLRIIDT